MPQDDTDNADEWLRIDEDLARVIADTPSAGRARLHAELNHLVRLARLLVEFDGFETRFCGCGGMRPENHSTGATPREALVTASGLLTMLDGGAIGALGEIGMRKPWGKPAADFLKRFCQPAKRTRARRLTRPKSRTR